MQEFRRKRLAHNRGAGFCRFHGKGCICHLDPPASLRLVLANGWVRVVAGYYRT